jgi:hypothetical protein
MNDDGNNHFITNSNSPYNKMHEVSILTIINEIYITTEDKDVHLPKAGIFNTIFALGI